MALSASRGVDEQAAGADLAKRANARALRHYRAFDR